MTVRLQPCLIRFGLSVHLSEHILPWTTFWMLLGREGVSWGEEGGGGRRLAASRQQQPLPGVVHVNTSLPHRSKELRRESSPARRTEQTKTQCRTMDDSTVLYCCRHCQKPCRSPMGCFSHERRCSVPFYSILFYSVLGCVPPLQEVATHQSPPSFYVFCYPCPHRSLLPHNVISPTTFRSSD